MQEVQALTCSQCGYTCFEAPADEILDEYYSHQYGTNAESWYNITADYSPSKVLSRSANVLQLRSEYLDDVESPIALEIGCAYGGTVQELRNRNIRAFGVDLNSTAIAEGRLRGNQHVFCQYAHSLMEKLGEKANIIYSYHALEHIVDPVVFLTSLINILDDQCILEFRVPNGAYLKPWIKGFQSWDWFAYPDHLHMFTPYSLLHLARKSGYNVLAITSDSCGESLESIGGWLGGSDSESMLPLYRRMLGRMLMLQELRFHLSPVGSATSRNNTCLIEATHRQCEGNLSAEQELKQICSSLSNS
jgi:SAM-dependent methyltransferase